MVDSGELRAKNSFGQGLPADDQGGVAAKIKGLGLLIEKNKGCPLVCGASINDFLYAHTPGKGIIADGGQGGRQLQALQVDAAPEAVGGDGLGCLGPGEAFQGDTVFKDTV